MENTEMLKMKAMLTAIALNKNLTDEQKKDAIDMAWEDIESGFKNTLDDMTADGSDLIVRFDAPEYGAELYTTPYGCYKLKKLNYRDCTYEVYNFTKEDAEFIKLY